MRRILTIFCLACAFASTVARGDPHVHVILSDDSPAYHAVTASLRAALGDVHVSVARLGAVPPTDATLLVPVGMHAAAQVMQPGETRPVFATLVPAASWRLLAATDDAPPNTALFLDQPLGRHAALVRVLLPPVRELGVVFGPTSELLADELDAAAARHNLRVHSARSGTPDDATAAVSAVLRRSEALLALPDPAVYNRFTVQAVLLATFRLRRPVVGFSDAWVKAGALGAVYSTPEQLGGELGTTIGAWLHSDLPIPDARHPATYTVSVNRQVAFSLGINVPSDASLLERLEALEAAQ